MGRNSTDKSFHNDFISNCNKVISESLAELHSNADKIHYVYGEILKEKDVLTKYGVRIENPAYNTVSIDLDGSNIKHLDRLLVKLLRLYNYIAIVKPNRLVARIELYTKFSKLDMTTYNRLLKLVNHTNVNCIVKGALYCFNGKVGSIRIVSTQRSGNGAVNIVKTQETYKALLEANITPLSPEHPDGTPYIVRHKTGDLYYKWNYCKSGELAAVIPKEYVFIANRTEHVVGQNEHLTKQEVYDSPMSGVIKMFVLMRIDPLYHTRYHKAYHKSYNTN